MAEGFELEHDRFQDMVWGDFADGGKQMKGQWSSGVHEVSSCCGTCRARKMTL